jgi:Xaa-Pro aminopeptidase
VDIQAFADRRARLLRSMGRGIAVIPTAPERVRNRDSHYPYRHDSYFYYLTGFPEPEAALVLIAGDSPQALLFCREKDPDKEVWDGFRHGPEAARATFGFDAALPIASLDDKLFELLAGQPVLHYSMGHDANWDDCLVKALNRVRADVRNGVHAPAQIRDVRSLTRRDAPDQGHQRDRHHAPRRRHLRQRPIAAPCAPPAPGRFEYEIEAELIHEFRRCGSQAPAYGPIVAGGANACVLHYVEQQTAAAGRRPAAHRRRLRARRLRLGHHPHLPGQRAASAAQKAMPTSWCWPHRPRPSIAHPRRARLERPRTTPPPGCVLAQGIHRPGLLHRQPRWRARVRQPTASFYMHRTGHWLGLDVHDAGEYKVAGEWRPLVPGMTLTVEPGCYIRPPKACHEAFWNIGIRIEDDALVTDSGCDILTEAAPKSIVEIEALMREPGGA